jgi:hypothetical protein
LKKALSLHQKSTKQITMTRNEIIKNFEVITNDNAVNGINVEDFDYPIQMCYINHQNGEIVTEYVSVLGFDDDDDFYIDFSDGCTAYMEDLDCNTEDGWELLWDLVLEYFNYV